MATFGPELVIIKKNNNNIRAMDETSVKESVEKSLRRATGNWRRQHGSPRARLT